MLLFLWYLYKLTVYTVYILIKLNITAILSVVSKYHFNWLHSGYTGYVLLFNPISANHCHPCPMNYSFKPTFL